MRSLPVLGGAALCAFLLAGAAPGTPAGHAGAVVARAAAFAPARSLPVRPRIHVRRAKLPERRTAPTPLPAPAPRAQTAIAAPNDPAWPQQWSLARVDAPAAWNLAVPLRQIVVAVVDSGVDPSQPDLQGALVPGADFADATGSTADQYGHGTLVAGVIAARGNNGQEVAGACWTCLVMPIKVLDANGTGTAAGIAAGLRWAVDHGANVINMSFILSGSDPGVEAAIGYAHDHGVLVVAAAGNSGDGTPTYPASYPGVISVAATDPTDELYPWSTRGPWVTLAAPGCTVSTALGGGVASFCGTSAAAPLVAGLAALAWSSTEASEPDLEAALEHTATPLPGEAAGGRIDAFRLLQQFVP